MPRIALVTGGTRGIGRSICRRLQAEGRTVAALYSGSEKDAADCRADLGCHRFGVSAGFEPDRDTGRAREPDPVARSSS